MPVLSGRSPEEKYDCLMESESVEFADAEDEDYVMTAARIIGVMN